jgi:hypothetical protein
VTVLAYTFPSFTQVALSGGFHAVPNLSSDTLKVGLATGTINRVASTEAYEYVSQFLANAGSGGGGALTEVTGGGYSRQSLASVTFGINGSNALQTVLSCANISWSATATWSAAYAFFWDETAGNGTDATRPLIGYWDLGGSSTVNNGGTFQLTINASGLLTWTAAQ